MPEINSLLSRELLMCKLIPGQMVGVLELREIDIAMQLFYDGCKVGLEG